MLEMIELHDYTHLRDYLAIRAGVIMACWVFVILACLVDFWSGTTTAKALGHKLISHGFRKTIAKISDYARVMMFALMFDAIGSLFEFYKLPFASMLGAAAVLCIEGKSVFENSRRKKSHAAEIPAIVEQIIAATRTKDAAKVMGDMAQALANSEKAQEYERKDETLSEAIKRYIDEKMAESENDDMEKNL